MHDSNASCLHTYPTADSQPLYDVPCVTLPTLLAQEGGGSKLALIKIDVDGAEPAFFAGALSVLMRDKPLVITEFAPTSLRDAGRDPYEFFKFLSSRFVVYWLQIQQWPLRRVAVEDFQEIIEQVGPAVTDLILSPAALPVDETLAAVF
jgi:hypothetical protein